MTSFSQMAESTLAYTLTKITVRGDSAELDFNDPKPDSGTSQKQRVVLAAGEWKFGR